MGQSPVGVFAAFLFLSLCTGCMSETESNYSDSSYTNVTVKDWQVVLTQVLFRHGQRNRNAAFTYPSDPFKDESTYWPEGYGQLSRAGMRQTYELGIYLRRRYSELLKSSYSVNQVYAASSDLDRAITSAQCVLAGLYPPEPAERWKADLAWQPIPVHSIPTNLDIMFRNRNKCPRLETMIQQVKRTRAMKQFEEQHPDLFTYLSEHAGRNLSSIEHGSAMYSVFALQDAQGYPLPDWVRKVYPNPLFQLRSIDLASAAYTTEIQRLRAGPMLVDMVQHMRDAVAGNATARMFLYSGHDSDLAAMMRAIGRTRMLVPHFTDSLLVELLRSPQGEYGVRILYLNTVGGYNLTAEPVLECNFLCPLSKFLTLTGPLMPEDWFTECELNPLKFWKNAPAPATRPLWQEDDEWAKEILQ